MEKPVVSIKYTGNGWEVKLQNHEPKKEAWAATGAMAWDKAKIIADYIGCNIQWRSKFDEDGNIIQLSEPEIEHRRRLGNGKVNGVAKES